MSAKRQQNITYGIRGKLTLISPGLKTQGFYAAFYKSRLISPDTDQTGTCTQRETASNAL